MIAYYRSGIEGYCKAAAEILGEKSAQESWKRFCNDIMRDASDKVWAMSRMRQGRSNRLMQFERAWMKEYHANSYATAAINLEEKALGRKMTEDEKLSFRRKKIFECESGAIESCVNSMMAHWGSIDEDGSELELLTGIIDFPIQFHAQVIPAIERGFVSEGFRQSDITLFSNILDEIINTNLTNKDTFESLCRALVAGLIYGPAHLVATNRPWDATEVYIDSDAYEVSDIISNEKIRVTQLFGESMSAVGYSEVYDSNTAILFGRCTDAAQYIQRFNDVFSEPDQKNVQEVLGRAEKVIYPIAGKHDMTSNIHGILFYDTSQWYYYDLGSTNGTSVATGDITHGKTDILQVFGLLSIEAGYRIRLGAPIDAVGDSLYKGATTVLVSLSIDEGEDF